MPNLLSNNSVVAFIEDKGWFSFNTSSSFELPSDNWRLVENLVSGTAILYIVVHYASSLSGEPQRIPNEADALPRLAKLHEQLPEPKFGPFIALATVSERDVKVQILSVKVWDISTQVTPDATPLAVSELGEPLFSHPRRI